MNKILVNKIFFLSLLVSTTGGGKDLSASFDRNFKNEEANLENKPNLDSKKSKLNKDLIDYAGAHKSRALKEYWDAYSAYTKKRWDKKRNDYKEAVDRLIDEETKEDRSRMAEEIELLRAAIENYREQLKNLPDATSVPDTLLNLSIALNNYANTLGKMNEDNTFQREEIVQLLQEHLKQFPGDENHDKAKYFLANNLEMTDQKERAISIWKDLSNSSKDNIYTVHANVIMADHYFESDLYDKSIQHLNKALGKQSVSGGSRFNPLNTQIYYRLAWSNYRGGRLEDAISNCESILKPSAADFPSLIRDGMKRDVITVISNALYEIRDLNKIRQYLSKRELESIAGELTLKTTEKFQDLDDHKSVNLIVSSMSEYLSLDANFPKILVTWAKSLDRLRLVEERIEVLEDIAVLLPANSLWRSRNSHNKEAVSGMEESAKWAAITSANWNLERAMASGSKESFRVSEQMFTVLKEAFPLDEKVNEWEIQKATCQLLSDKLQEAQKSFLALSKNLSIKPNQLETILYQQVIASERLWRKAYAEAIDGRKEPSLDSKSTEELLSFQQSALNYANKYPKQVRSTDLILATAAAWRDQGNYQKASELWQRVLLSHSEKHQRALAIRGLVFAPIAMGNMEDSVSVISRFLKLEDWKVLGQPLRSELENTLSYTIEKLQDHLVGQGKYAEAAELLLTNASRQKNMPKSDRFYRDGAYYQAMAGKWLAAEDSASTYLNENGGKYRGDMLYLEAKAQEYQLKFTEAAKTYLSLAEKNADHKKASMAVGKALNLAIANNDLESQAKALDLAIQREKQPEKKYELLIQGAEIRMKMGNNKAATKLVSLAKSTSTLAIDRYNAEIFEAKLLLDAQQFETATRKIDDIKKRADLDKAKIGREDWGEIISKSCLVLADEEHKKFMSSRINHEDRDVMRALAIKTEIFEDLAKLYIETIQTNSQAYSPEARFRMAEAAAELHTDIEVVLQKQEQSLPYRDQERIKAQSQRLENIRKSLHADNAIAGSKDASRIVTNQWIRKSWIRVNSGKLSDSGPSIPTSMRIQRPNEWSL